MINHFQRLLYEKLNADETLPPCYISIQKDIKYPFILINFDKLLNLSKAKFELYRAEFSISIYARDKTKSQLLEIAKQIDNHMNSDDIKALIVSMRKQGYEWVNAHDLMLTKLLVNYKALLKPNIEEK